MSLEQKSKELKNLISSYDTEWFLGDLSGLMKNISDDRAKDQLGELSSPLRQLYYLGGLLISADPANGNDFQYSPEKWKEIVRLLNEIEKEYELVFSPKEDEHIDEEWQRIRMVAMPSFLSYFNQGPLNYEEQIINWINDLYTPLDEIIQQKTGLKTEDFIQFYKKIDALNQSNFQSVSNKGGVPRENWKSYTKLSAGVAEGVPDFIREMGEKNAPLFTFMSDHGIIQRFLPEELVTNTLSLESVKTILNILSCQRVESDFLYYTSTKPGNPLYDKPIIQIRENMFQVFEVKQVIHAIERFFESICSVGKESLNKLVTRKGKLLENRIVELFKVFFNDDFEVYTSFYIDGNEQDILFLWKKYAFIIEAKGYKLNEPFRDPNRAFVRIKQDFDACIGYGYKQAKRVQQQFIDQVPLKMEDKNGNVTKEIDTTKYENNYFSIIVNLHSFGQIQNDLSTLLEIEEDDVFPWAVKLDDLEVLLLTFKAKGKSKLSFVDFLLLRENLHGKLICSDELQVGGAFLQGRLSDKDIEQAEVIVLTPDLANIFDEQYRKGMGFKDENMLAEKKSGSHIFW
ncbi:hypothetical protein SAMN05421820_102544 [Pedobacter steynii]|uniref:NERD domain-containing protein n=1 Tax=Pedobacter steynii TaxID=430522 RepID=A0A1G9P4R6_9SPHI|nr:hypothetical protein [Pedobacter steynii]NQX39092.1 hypothetical protein [Pedobacter steynii]SDL93766.1 hypothetical protein SAMN05421820_102544 [Pedobacter steynii]